MYRLAVMAFWLGQIGTDRPASIQLRVEAPAELTGIRTRLESIDPQNLADISQLVGLSDAGTDIRVVLAAEGSDMARNVPSWIAGLAIGGSDMVVIFPARSPSYPNSTLEDVLRHEVAHVLIRRASAGRPIPRWFNEGLAMAAERKRRFQDQTQFLYQLVAGHRANLEELDQLFLGGRNDQTRAYALAGALVHDLIAQHGPSACGEILMRVRSGGRFDLAFAEVTGETLADMEGEFWYRHRIWTSWVPIMTSSTALWLAVAILAILAIYRRRRRNREIEKQWSSEEDDEVDPD